MENQCCYVAIAFEMLHKMLSRSDLLSCWIPVLFVINMFHANSHFKHIAEFINQAFVKNGAWVGAWVCFAHRSSLCLISYNLFLFFSKLFKWICKVLLLMFSSIYIISFSSLISSCMFSLFFIELYLMVSLLIIISNASRNNWSFIVNWILSSGTLLLLLLFYIRLLYHKLQFYLLLHNLYLLIVIYWIFSILFHVHFPII